MGRWLVDLVDTVVDSHKRVLAGDATDFGVGHAIGCRHDHEDGRNVVSNGTGCLPQERGALHDIGACLRENLRRYDSVGLTSGGALMLVLPDISRGGLAGAAERLRRELDACAGQSPAPELVFALAHYDFVDVNAAEMMAGLQRSMHQARSSHQPLAWA